MGEADEKVIMIASWKTAQELCEHDHELENHIVINPALKEDFVWVVPMTEWERMMGTASVYERGKAKNDADGDGQVSS